MEYYLFIARSVTYAQRMARALDRCGVSASVMRAPTGLSELGCAYAVRLRRSQADVALDCLRRVQLAPKHIYVRSENSYREVVR